MGRPRVADLAHAICESATDFAIPRSEIAKAKEHMDRTGSTAHLSRLYNEARALFTDLVSSGEGGELLLFVLAETLLRLPQIMCKMSLKTSARMHVHGVDGVHAGVDPDTERLVLYWGESKIYDDAATAIRDCLASLAPVLLETGPTATRTRDLQLLQRATDLNDPALESALKLFLDPRDPAFNSLEFRGLCLVGFDSDAYPQNVAELQHDVIVQALTDQLPAWKRQIQRRISAERMEAFALQMICLPFPKASEFREFVRQSLGVTGASS
jgi:hypothetical protein